MDFFFLGFDFAYVVGRSSSDPHLHTSNPPDPDDNVTEALMRQSLGATAAAVSSSDNPENSSHRKELHCDVKIGDGMDIGIQGENGQVKWRRDTDEIDFPFDNVSESSYRSHQNRNFNSGSHKGSYLNIVKKGVIIGILDPLIRSL